MIMQVHIQLLAPGEANGNELGFRTVYFADEICNENIQKVMKN